MVRSLTLVAGNQQTAEESVQDAFERAFVRWRRISGYDDPVAWIRRVAINRIRDHGRREGRRFRALERLRGESVTSVEPLHTVELTDVLMELPRQQRAAAALFYVEGLPVTDVAAAMGVSEGAVKYHLNKARERLRPLLSADAEESSA